MSSPKRQESPIETTWKPYEIEPKSLRNSELMVMFVLCKEGFKTKAELSKLTGRRWQTVSTIVKRFMNMGLVEVVGETRSEKGVKIEIYGLTREGWLSFIGRIPRWNLSLNEVAKKRLFNKRHITRIEWNDYKVKRDNSNVYLEMMFRLLNGEFSRCHRHLFPLVFEHEKESMAFDGLLPQIAFETLRDYHQEFFLLLGDKNDLESIFTLKYYTYVLDELSKPIPGLAGGIAKELGEINCAKVLELYEDPELTDTVREASKRMVEKSSKQASFLLNVEKRFGLGAICQKQGGRYNT